MKFRFIHTLCFTLLALGTSASQKYTISGTVKDSATGESIIGATLYVPEANTGANTNMYGFYSITLQEGHYSLIFNYIGKQTRTLSIDLHANTKLDVDLADKAMALKNVVVTGEREDKNVSSSEMSSNHLEMDQIKQIPVLFGEVDILKTISLLPGVMSVGEGNTGFYVRGGAADQNLVLLDEAVVYNASHLLGFFSVFNGDAIKDISLVKGGIPAEYGGRLASVLDIHMNEGNTHRITVKGGIGLIASRLTLEGPLVKDKGSFLISARRSYADLLLQTLGPASVHSLSLYFYDLNLKANYRFGSKDRIFLSGYFGRDVLAISGLGVTWGNATGTLRWNHIWNDKLFQNTSAIFSNYQYEVGINSGGNTFGVKSSIQDYTLKTAFEYYLNENNKIRFGLNETYHIFTPGTVFSNGINLLNDLSIEKKYALESAVYVSNEQKAGDHFLFTYGLRYSLFDQLGPGKTFRYDTSGAVIDTNYTRGNKVIQEYGGLEPRLGIRYQINKSSSVKASYTRTMQYLQLLSNTTSSTPTDLWISSTNVIKPQVCDQYALGYFRNFRDNMFETSLEVYYKDMQNQVDYKPGADIVLNPIVESQLYFGRGRSYGTELFIKKTKGKLTGWIGYSLSRTERLFTYINNNSWYPAKQDRTHDISVTALYSWNERWSFGAVWVYASGNAVTFPEGKYEFQGHMVSYYTARNSYRMPAYHRLDLSATYHCKPKQKVESDWNFSVYNVYDRHNTYSINFQQDPNNTTNTQAVKTWLFGIVPAVTYNFKF